MEVSRLHCVAERGIQGDRFFDYKPDYKGQITFFALEEYERLCALFELHHPGTEVFRRNVIVSGVDLSSLIGKDFSIQGVLFHGHSECSPCYWMDQAFHPGTEAALKGRGGLRAQILSGGDLRVSADLLHGTEALEVLTV